VNENHDLLDSLIDHALASYTPAEPRPGLEQRILASMVAASQPRTWAWRPAWALAAAAALIAVVGLPVAFKSMRTQTAVVHLPVAAPPAIAEQHLSPRPAPALTSSARRPHTAHLRPAATEPEVPEAAAQSSLGLIASLTIAPIHNQPLTDEAIEMKPITITPIQIAALN
jgi:hypothetical protein